MSSTETTTETKTLTNVEAVREALYGELQRDDDVVVLGEDVGRSGGVFRATDGLQDEFGEERIIDTPLAESAIVGTGVGMAAHGLKPVSEIQFAGFLPLAFDQITSHAAKMRNKTRGSFTCPMVIRAPYGAGVKSPEYHAESNEAYFTNVPGLKIAMPSTPYDTKGMLTAAIRDPDPVLFLEPKLIYRTFRNDVPTAPYEVPLGEASVRREGSDISLFTWGAMTRPSLLAAENLAGEGIDVEVVDLRTLYPYDRDTIVESMEKTRRAVVVHEAPRTSGFGAEVVAKLQEESLYHFERPIQRITGFDTPTPLKGMEDFYLIEPVRIEHEIRSVMA